jgi:hypothetical protein
MRRERKQNWQAYKLGRYTREGTNCSSFIQQKFLECQGKAMEIQLERHIISVHMGLMEGLSKPKCFTEDKELSLPKYLGHHGFCILKAANIF